MPGPDPPRPCLEGALPVRPAALPSCGEQMRPGHQRYHSPEAAYSSNSSEDDIISTVSPDPKETMLLALGRGHFFLWTKSWVDGKEIASLMLKRGSTGSFPLESGEASVQHREGKKLSVGASRLVEPGFSVGGTQINLESQPESGRGIRQALNPLQGLCRRREETLLMAYKTEDHKTQYCFPAINSSCIKTKRSTHVYNIMYVFFSLLSIWTVFLNLLVIISISHFKKLHTPTNMLILSLALADLLIGLIVMPLEAIRLIETCWYFGETICRVFSVIMGLLFSASLSNLVLIAVDRYVAVCHPLLYPQKITVTRIITIICVSWFCYSAYNISALTTSQTNSTCKGECIFMLTFDWKITDLFVSFLFPCTIIITLYLRIFYVAHHQVKVINSLMRSGKHLTEGSVRRKSESKAALTLGIIVMVYLFCWIPFYSLSLTPNTRMTSVIACFTLWMVYISSALNPLIYAIFYPWFRTSVKYILNLSKLFKPS
ncbi:trace amine-associated receptor 13c-like [Paramisgurnus dabryanus]|uniref:trace amine-associated receptor 13c-like n=1 Tax=Paramisgurnus dabryanus TaxID=90735 RepID=UPI0031F3B7F6